MTYNEKSNDLLKSYQTPSLHAPGKEQAHKVCTRVPCIWIIDLSKKPIHWSVKMKMRLRLRSFHSSNVADVVYKGQKQKPNPKNRTLMDSWDWKKLSSLLTISLRLGFFSAGNRDTRKNRWSSVGKLETLVGNERTLRTQNLSVAMLLITIQEGSSPDRHINLTIVYQMQLTYCSC